MINLKITRRINRVYFILYRLFFVKKSKNSFVHIGSSKGGWSIPKDLVNSEWVCYSAGVGDDISFDLDMIKTFGCTIHALDPTPRAINYLESLKDLPKEFIFHPVGIWNEDCVQKFYAPQLDISSNFSIKNLEKTEEFIEADCKTLKTMMVEFNTPDIDLLKIDIEGAEHEVIDSIYMEKISPKILCVEFDQPSSLSSMLNSIGKLKKLGYQLVCINIFDFTFVRS